MSTAFRSRGVRTLVSLVLTVVFWAGLMRLTDAQSPPPAQQAALNTLASYTVDTPRDQTASWLQKMGYHPAVPAQEWAQYPAQRKLAIAYIAAHRADPQRGGDRLLAALSQDLARRYDSAYEAPSLKPYLSAPAPERSLAFSNPPALPVSLELPPRVSDAIRTLAEYSTSGPLGSPRTILTTHFGVPAADVDRLLLDSRSNHEAFKRAAARLDAAGQRHAVTSWATAAASRYDAIWHEPAMAPYLPPRDIMPSTGGLPSVPRARPAVPPATTSSTGAAQRFGSVVKSAPPHFRTASVRIRGLGGVLFGNDVTSSASLVPLTVAYEPGGTSSSGVFKITLSDGSVVQHPNVSADVAHVAFRLIYASSTRLSSGTAIGIAGITDGSERVVCDSTTYRADIGRRFNVALAPALVGTDLGWSALTVDALPVDETQLFARARRVGPDVETALIALFRLESPAGFESVGTWKVVDVPMAISRAGGDLVVERAQEAGAPRPIGLRRTAFLEMRRFIESTTPRPSAPGSSAEDDVYDEDFAEQFYRLLPLLMRAVPDYARMNDLARGLAIVRWAKFNGARFLAAPPKPASVRTPNAILVSQTAITAVQEFEPGNPFLELLEARGQARQCMEEAESSSAAVREFAARAKAALDSGPSALTRLEPAARVTPATRFWWRLFKYLEDF